MAYGIFFSMSVIFLIDLSTPLGVADGTLYVVPVLASLWLKETRITIAAGLASVVLILLGYFLSPPMVSQMWVVITNRSYSVFAVAVVAALCVICKRSISTSQETKDMLESIIADSFDALVKINSEGKVQGWNSSCERIFGWTRQEALGRYVADLIIPPQFHDEHHKGINRFLNTGVRGIINQHVETTALRKDRTEFPVELTISAIKHHDHYVFSAVVRDISERKRLEKQNQGYALELGKSLKKEKFHRQAIEIANSQLQNFSTQLEINLMELEKAYLQTLNSLSLAAEFKDEDTGQHLARISRYCDILTKAAGLSQEESKNIALASPMHDIGKVGIPDLVLQKNSKLTQAEFDMVKQHTHIGAEILGDSDSTVIALAREIALSHHEKWNGKGYPQGLAGENIPLSARIVGLVDCFDALTSPRPYKIPYPVEMAYEIIVKEKGGSFDPDLVECFIKVFDQFKQVAMSHAKSPAGDQGLFQWSDRDRHEQTHNKPWWADEFSEPDLQPSKNEPEPKLNMGEDPGLR